MNLVMLGLSLGAVICFGSFVLYGAWVDGHRQTLRDDGLHPTTDRTGKVHARERDAREREDHDGH